MLHISRISYRQNGSLFSERSPRVRIRSTRTKYFRTVLSCRLTRMLTTMSFDCSQLWQKLLTTTWCCTNKLTVVLVYWEPEPLFDKRMTHHFRESASIKSRRDIIIFVSSRPSTNDYARRSYLSSNRLLWTHHPHRLEIPMGVTV